MCKYTDELTIVFFGTWVGQIVNDRYLHVIFRHGWVFVTINVGLTQAAPIICTWVDHTCTGADICSLSSVFSDEESCHFKNLKLFGCFGCQAGCIAITPLLMLL